MPNSKPFLSVVSSLVLQVRPEAMDAVTAYLNAQKNIEVHASDGFSKLVIVAEMQNDIELSEFMNAVATVEGVVTVNMVFHHTDTEAEAGCQAQQNQPNESVITFKEANRHA